MSGVDGDTAYLVHTNLTGAYNCLELARRDGAFVVFLSTSRVYPVAPQVELTLEEAADPLRDRRRAGGRRGLSRRASPRTSRWRVRAPSTARPSSPPSC